MKFAGIILAAGASRRMGRPKALLEWEGRTFLDHLIGVLGECCDPVIAVLGHDAAAIRAGLRDAAGARLVENPHPDRGMLSSLQCGLRALDPQCEGFLFTPVDQPAAPRSVPRLLAELVEGGAALAVPRYQGRRGHPVACSAVFIEEFLREPPGGQARDVVARHRAQAAYLEVDEPGVVLDVDYPEDYQTLLAGARGQ
jgi:molybdenum cofactor cytidylyltransferase